jgi:hypothetical protein
LFDDGSVVLRQLVDRLEAPQEVIVLVMLEAAVPGLFGQIEHGEGARDARREIRQMTLAAALREDPARRLGPAILGNAGRLWFGLHQREEREQGEDDQKYLRSIRRATYNPAAKPTTLNMRAVAKPTQLPIHHPSQLPIVAPRKARSRDKFF